MKIDFSFWGTHGKIHTYVAWQWHWKLPKFWMAVSCLSPKFSMSRNFIDGKYWPWVATPRKLSAFVAVVSLQSKVVALQKQI